MNNLWQRRQAQWKLYQKWAARQPESALSPSERLAEVGALVDRAQPSASGPPMRVTIAAIQGIVMMRTRLAVLGRHTS